MSGRKGRQASNHKASMKYLAQMTWKDFEQEAGKIRLKNVI